MWSLYQDPDGKSVFEKEECNQGVHTISKMRTSMK